ncbi:hypothetical protein A3649_03045 [Mycobacterium ulcerans]|nr:hypothetical protein A3649_03045 [Mycobacterium ulcerans]
MGRRGRRISRGPVRMQDQPRVGEDFIVGSRHRGPLMRTFIAYVASVSSTSTTRTTMIASGARREFYR